MKAYRRWFQFSLRGFIVILTIGSVWLGVLVNRAREQREAVKAICNLDGGVLWDKNFHTYGDGVDTLTRIRMLIGLDYFQTVEVVCFLMPNNTDVQILTSIPHMRRLRCLKRVLLPPFVNNATRDQVKRALPHCEVIVAKWRQ